MLDQSGSLTRRPMAVADDRAGDGSGTPGSPLPHRRLILVVGAVVVAAVLVIWLVAFSSLFGVKTVRVVGPQPLTSSVLAAADVKSGTPLVRLDTGAIARRVQALPDVAAVTVRKHYPTTVVITLTERVAVGYLASGSHYLLLDKTGEQFRTTATKPKNLPLFAIPSGAQAKATGQALATVAASLPASLRAKVASIQGFDPNAITLLLTDQRVVRWGSASRSADKARILPTLLKQKDTQVDVSDPDQPFIH